MNRIYKVIWSKTRNCYVVASEIAKRQTKSGNLFAGTLVRGALAGAIFVSLTAGMCSPAWATGAVAVGVDPQSWTEGAVSLQQDGNGPWAEGNYSIAIGRGDGVWTHAGGYASIAIGSGANALNGYSVAMGSSAYSNNQGTALGSNAYSNSSGTALGYNARSNTDGNVAVGVYSAASGYYSVAMGRQASASNSFAVALGNYASASGEASVAIGGATWSNTAEAARASGARSVAIGAASYDTGGSDNIAMGSGAHVGMGPGMQFPPTYGSIAMGYNAQVNNIDWGDSRTIKMSSTNSIAIGTWARAEAKDTTTVGRNSRAMMRNATAYGNNAHANSANSVAIGNKAIAGLHTHIFQGEPNYNQYGWIKDDVASDAAIDDSAVAIGNRATAVNNYTTAVGVSTFAEGSHSTAVGDSNRATGDHSTAIGAGESYYDVPGETNGVEDFNNETTRVYRQVLANQAAGDFSNAIGYMNRTVGKNSSGFGYKNDVSGEDSLAVGSLNKVGTVKAEEGKDRDGNPTGEYDGLLETDQENTVTGYAVGSENEITGRENTNAGTYGYKNIVKADNSYVIGNMSKITETKAKDSFVIGNNAEAKVEKSVALGTESIASEGPNNTGGFNVLTGMDDYKGTKKDQYAWISTHGSVSVGAGDDGTVTRQIKNVAAGKLDTDAVNVAQLKLAQVELVAGDNVEIIKDTSDGHAVYTIHSLNAMVEEGDNITVTSRDGGNSETNGRTAEAANGGTTEVDGAAPVASDDPITPDENNHTRIYKVSTKDTVTKIVAGDNVTVEDISEEGDTNITYKINAEGTKIKTLKADYSNVSDTSNKGTLKITDTAGNEYNTTLQDTYTVKAETNPDDHTITFTRNDGGTYKAENIATMDDINNIQGDIYHLDTKIEKVGAGAAALAGLHPLDFDPDEKWDFAAALGSYKSEQAVAIGAFYRPNEDTMFSIGGTVGNGNNMVNVGVSWKFGQKNRISANRISSAKEIIELRKNQENVHSFLADAVAGNQLDLSKIQLFPDVEENHWAYDYVATMAGNGVLEGYPDGYFKGNRNMTRYEMAAVLYRLMQNGARLSDRALTEFAPELDRIRVDTITHHKDGTPHIQRVRTIKERVEEKADPAQVADEKAEKERLAQEKKAAVQAEKERLAQEKAEAKAEKERLAQEKAEAKAEKERLAQEKKAEEKAAKEKAALEKKAEEQAAKEKLAQEKAEAKAAKEKAAEEKKAAAKAAKEKAAQEKAAAKAAKAKAE